MAPYSIRPSFHSSPGVAARSLAARRAQNVLAIILADNSLVRFHNAQVMGLDWNPGSKAKSGHEQEFCELWKKLHGRFCFFRAQKVKRFAEITITAFETLATPRVGIDVPATDWARKQAFPKIKDKTVTEDVFLQKMHGFYVLEIVPPCDGLPRYSNGSPGGYVEQYAFRGQFLKDCEKIIGKELLESGFVSKSPEDTLKYGDDLIEAATKYSTTHQIDVSNIQLAEDPDKIEFQLDVVFSAGRWCRFWAEKGHWLDAYW